MLTRVYVGVALGYFALFLTGCGHRPEAKKGPPAGKQGSAGGVQPVTLHVAGMTERLGLF